ncbi:amidase [Gordonia sp. (in: high G+C Gram-positive bacteria)]|uniref:amidase n=1 Tax=Gordonia sp. (in: high G+C Gram-positive bacteria) TaxID=84139 RepID=UPI003C70C5CB
MEHVHAFGDDCLGEMDALGIGRSITAGECSPLEAAEAALARIDAVEPALAAIAYDDRDRALRRAREGDFGGVFAGVPSVVKNNVLFAGIPTRNGSAALADVAPARVDEPVTGEFVGTGLNVLGASTLPAFGLTATTEFVDREPTRNPWNTAYSCGASSGGSAALVAAGAVPIAHANDGGGSIRIPAASCGLVGLKPSRGRVARAAQMRGLPIDLVSNGVVTRTVRDTAYYYADLERQRSVDLPPIGLVEGPGTRRLRVALLNTPLSGRLLDADTERELTAAVDLLESLGHRVTTIPMPVDRAYIQQFTDYWALLAWGIDHLGKHTIGKGFDRSALDPFTRGLSSSFVRHFYRLPASIIGLRRATARFEAVFDHYDVVLSPTLGHAVPEIGFLDPGGDFDEIFARLIDYVAFTPANNTGGSPAISVPLGRSSAGLPLGIHFSASLGDERTLLELAYELEAAAPFARIQD